jgi:hypothetical protein
MKTTLGKIENMPIILVSILSTSQRNSIMNTGICEITDLRCRLQQKQRCASHLNHKYASCSCRQAIKMSFDGRSLHLRWFWWHNVMLHKCSWLPSQLPQQMSLKLLLLSLLDRLSFVVFQTRLVGLYDVIVFATWVKMSKSSCRRI